MTEKGKDYPYCGHMSKWDLDVIRWIFNLRNVTVLITEVFLEYILAIFYIQGVSRL